MAEESVADRQRKKLQDFIYGYLMGVRDVVTPRELQVAVQRDFDPDGRIEVPHVPPTVADIYCAVVDLIEAGKAEHAHITEGMNEGVPGWRLIRSK